MPGPAERLRAWVPRWWRGEAGVAGALLSGALLPLEQLYRASVGIRNAAYDREILAAAAPPLPVVSVGNLAVGGAGKTPLTAWLAALLRERGERPAVVLRGYGSDEVQVHRGLNPGVPVIAGADRVAGVLAAHQRGCTVAVLDDAFQHRRLARSLDVVLVAAESWTERRRLLPRGPWREPLEALSRADLLVVTRKSAPASEAERVRAAIARSAPALPSLLCHLAPTGLAPLEGRGEGRELGWLRGREVVAVASLAAPAPFAEQLRQQGARVELHAFPDHHEFTDRDARRLRGAAVGRALVMTRKEAVKLRGRLGADLSAWVLDQGVLPESGVEELDRLLQPLLSR